jgi:hypothetical protein
MVAQLGSEHSKSCVHGDKHDGLGVDTGVEEGVGVLDCVICVAEGVGVRVGVRDGVRDGEHPESIKHSQQRVAVLQCRVAQLMLGQSASTSHAPAKGH